jgi:hypothetical protein
MAVKWGRHMASGAKVQITRDTFQSVPWLFWKRLAVTMKPSVLISPTTFSFLLSFSPLRPGVYVKFFSHSGMEALNTHYRRSMENIQILIKTWYCYHCLTFLPLAAVCLGVSFITSQKSNLRADLTTENTVLSCTQKTRSHFRHVYF